MPAACREIAVMAFQNPQRGVVRQRQVTGRARKDMAAIRTEKKGVKSAPVEEQQRLLPMLHGFPERLDQWKGKERRPALAVPLCSHVDHFDERQWVLVHSAREGQVAVTPFHGLKIGLDPRRCGAEDYRGLLEFSAHHGEVPRIVPQTVILFVGGVMLFIHDDQPKIPNRCKKGGSRPDNQADIAAAELFPLVMPGALGDPAVHHRDRPLGETFADAGEKLRGQQSPDQIIAPPPF